MQSSFWEDLFAVFFALAAMAWFMTAGGIIYVIIAFVDNVLFHKIVSIPFAAIGWFIQIKLRFNHIVLNDHTSTYSYLKKKCTSHTAWEKMDKTLLWVNQ